MKLRFDAKYLEILRPFMAKDDIRFYINGIHVRPYGEGVLLAATCGRAIALVYEKTGYAERPATLRCTPELFAAARKKPTKKGAHFSKLVVTSEEIPGTATAESTVPGAEGPRVVPAQPAKFRLRIAISGMEGSHLGETFVQAGEAELGGKYPDVSKIIPKREDLVPGAFGAYQISFLERLPKRFNNHRGSGYANGVQFFSRKGEEDAQAVICHVPAVPEFMAAIMPIRGPKSWEDTLPLWWSAETYAAASGGAA